MATSADSLAALFGGGVGSATTGSADLNGFDKILQGNDIWRQAAAPVLGTKFDTRTWSPGTTAGVTAGQAFLGSILNGLGQRSESQQLDKAASILPQLYANPASVNAPDGVDPEAFNVLKMAAMAKQANTNENIRQALATNYGMSYDPESKTVSRILGGGDPSATGGDNNVFDIFTDRNAHLQKPALNPQAVQKLATGKSLLGQLDSAIGLAEKSTPNPEWTSNIPVVGDYLGDVIGSTERGFNSSRNNTPEGQYKALLQLISEGSGKLISNSARQQIIDENMHNASLGKTGTPQGAADVLRRTKDIIAQDLLDQAGGYGEQGYKKVQDAISGADQVQTPEQRSTGPDLSKYSASQLAYMKAKGLVK